MEAGEGGHVPFTHHMPVVTVNEDPGETTDEDVPSAVDLATMGGIQRDASFRSGMSSAAADPPTTLGAVGKEKEKKHRLSGIFGLRRKKSEQDLRPVVDKHGHAHGKTEAEKAKERERYEKDLEMRRKEAERREAELAQGQSSSGRAQVK